MKTYTEDEVRKLTELLVKQTIECCAVTAHYPTEVEPTDVYMRARWYTRKDILASKDKLTKLIMSGI